MFICIIALRRVSFKPYIVLIKTEFFQYICEFVHGVEPLICLYFVVESHNY